MCYAATPSVQPLFSNFGPTLALGNDAAELLRVNDPVVELEGVHGLQDGRDSADVRVDLGVGQEVGRLVGDQQQLERLIFVYRLWPSWSSCYSGIRGPGFISNRKRIFQLYLPIAEHIKSRFYKNRLT